GVRDQHRLCKPITEFPKVALLQRQKLLPLLRQGERPCPVRIELLGTTRQGRRSHETEAHQFTKDISRVRPEGVALDLHYMSAGFRTETNQFLTDGVKGKVVTDAPQRVK